MNSKRSLVNFNKFLKYIFLYVCLAVQQVSARDVQILPQPSVLEGYSEIVQWADKNLPQTGTLKQGREGYVYLKVDDGYIKDLFPLLKLTGYSIPGYFRRPNSPGAHISVMYVKESKSIGKIDEIGQNFTFKPKNIVFVPSRRPKYVVLTVEAPQLQQLRSKYSLSPLLQNHDFHITIAKNNGS